MTPISLLTNITETTIVSGERRLERVEVEQPVRLDVEIADLEAVALELAHRVERRLVLGLDRDQVLALVLVEMRRALQRQIDRLGGTRGPDQLLGVTMDQLGDFLARLLDRLLGLPAERVRTRSRVAEMLGQVRNHLGRDPRIDRGRRRIIEIDRFFHRGLGMRYTAGTGSDFLPAEAR